MHRALVFGLAQTGEAVARQLRSRGVEVIAADDQPSATARSVADSLHVALVEAPDDGELRRLVRAVDVVLPSPGVPGHHAVVAFARGAGTPVWSEFELVAQWGHPPLLAVTGTNGKTTVTTLVTDMLAASGMSVVAAGNNELPLVDAVDSSRSGRLDAVVVEASSFRLAFTDSFRPAVATWLNVSADHLDWHGSMDAYVAAKARIWARQGPEDVAVANADDSVVMAEAARTRARVQTFGAASVAHGSVLDVVAVAELPRRQPHDLANAAAAILTATGGGADQEACATVLREFRGLPHRVELIGDASGVAYYDDSKATTPASVVAAVEGFVSVVLIAGGRNKGLDLSGLGAVAGRVRAVVAIGEAAPAIATVFAGHRPVVEAASMDEAVREATRLARPGDTVLLSPGCTSLDWYRSYAERGDDFARAVRELVAAAP